MSTYVIGDIQGCWQTLQALLRRVELDAASDRVVLVGDLVNRGPSNVQVLRWAVSLGDRCTAVLGNHDLKLLVRASGNGRRGELDTLDDVLGAPDRDELIAWLRRLPLALPADRGLVVHAGLFPQWSASQALELSAEVEAVLRKGSLEDATARLRGKAPTRWSDALRGEERWAAILGGFLRLRTCTKAGAACWDFSGPPEGAPKGCIPWFDVPDRASHGTRVLFGHWSSLGLKVRDDIAALDTGCVWGRRLTALRLEDGKVVQEECRDDVPRRREAE